MNDLIKRAFMAFSQGFTLIEMVTGIVIIGILSAITLPKYIDTSSQANVAVTNTVTAALRTGSVLNANAKKAGAAGAVTLNQADVCPTAILSLIVGGGTLPTGYTTTGFSGAPGNCSGSNTEVYCSVFFNGAYVSFTPISCAR